jgi:WhiB family transcriptional regulator, redox-sensing transcriptional regulator
MSTLSPVDLLAESPSWYLLSICADSQSYDPDIWFSDSDTARRICAHCPVRNNCLSYAMDIETDSDIQLVGVWGGLSPIQRKRLREHPDRLDRMRRVRSRTKLRLVPPLPMEPEQLSLLDALA